jgi:hypothetical protein|tara:strand:- start:213 stop:1010 length:798 start_codon:yes stop_codon:yes gene_type:complete
MYMILDTVPGASLLNSLGINVDELGTRPLVFYGGEGFAQMSGPWRLGGYAGIGATQAGSVFGLKMFANRDNVDGYQKPAFGNEANGDTLYNFSGNLSVTARLSFLLGAVTTEYVFPIFRDLEVMAGALMGIGRYTLSIDQHIGTPKWGKLGNNMYGEIYGDTVLIQLDGPDFDDEAKDNNESEFLRPINVTGTMTELSGTFFNFQPYVAIKWQFLDRMGLRISAGYNRGTIASGKWKLNGNRPINDSPESALHGITLRTVIYFGL